MIRGWTIEIRCHYCRSGAGRDFSGAGAYSDGKLSLSPDVGGDLPDFIGHDKTEELIQYVDSIYLSYNADKKIYGIDKPEMIEDIKTRAIRSNLKLINRAG
jgi:uncharacterized protein